jgi:uncharacterized protein YjbJ (UPF0337 family)
MAGKMDKLKGRTKEAVADIKKDKPLKNQGKVDRATGSVKDAVGSAGDKVKKVVDKDA